MITKKSSPRAKLAAQAAAPRWLSVNLEASADGRTWKPMRVPERATAFRRAAAAALKSLRRKFHVR